jgi:uncharacterized OsmC-like protein
VAVRPKRLEFAVAIDEAGLASPDGREPLDFPDGWTPEHLVLTALAACSLASLAHHLKRAGREHAASASATGAVTRREDGRWGFVELECRVDLELEPEPPAEELAELLRKAERGCFIGASLHPHPTYRWRINGEPYSY